LAFQNDGDGRRVSKVGSKLYWYGSAGEILAETNASGATTAEYIFFGGKRVAMLPAGGSAQFYVEDLLGTSRILTTNTGVVCYDADFYPYGGERPPYTNNCPATNNYKFEGKERDTETGNDDFGARYYSNRFGRWLSADWSAVPAPVPYANLTNPQTLNLYSMVADDPESFADLDGHCGRITMPGAASATEGCPNPHATEGEGFDNGSSGLAAVECGISGESCTSSAEVSAQTSEIAAQQAAQANANQQSAQNQGQISLTLGDTKVTGEYSFGGTGLLAPDNRPLLGAVVDANAACTNCFWAQTISNSGSKQTTDAPLGKDSPLYVTDRTSQGNYHDTPSRAKGDAGSSTLVAVLGSADLKNHTFHAKGAMTYGYSVDKQGNVTGSAPRVATKKEIRQALAVVRREYPGWKIN